YLRFQGRDVETIDLYESKQALAKAAAAAKEAGAIEKTMPLFAAELSQTHRFDALVLPSILIRKTRVNDNNGRWDGVSRNVRMVNLPRLSPGGAFDATNEGIRFGGITGDVPVTSVHVVVLSHGGERLFEGRGGIEFTYEVDLSPARARF